MAGELILQVGDEVSGIEKDGERKFTGIVYQLEGINSGTIRRDDKIYGSGCYILEENNNRGWKFNSLEDYKLKLINKKGTNMDLKEKFTLAFKGEPEKSFRKTGITNGDDFLTEDGMKIFLGWMLKKHGDDFKKEVVDDLLAEMLKEKC